MFFGIGHSPRIVSIQVFVIIQAIMGKVVIAGVVVGFNLRMAL